MSANAALAFLLLLAGRTSMAVSEADADADVSRARKEKSDAPEFVVAEMGSKVVWCSGDGGDRQQQAGFSRCVWRLPSGDECDFMAGEKNAVCAADRRVRAYSNRTAANNGNRNCAIEISRASERHHGLWKCEMLGPSGQYTEGAAEVSVAREAIVEFSKEWGVVTVVEGRERRLSCKAEHGRPLGSFEFWVGERDAGGEWESVDVTEEPSVARDNKGTFTVFQAVAFVPKETDDDRRLFCSYSQYDESGVELHRSSDHITLTVQYLQQPDMDKPLVVPTVEAGSDLNVTVEFGASPRPKNNDVSWVVKTGGKIVEMTLDEVPFTKGGYYTVHPLESAGRGVGAYSATLTVTAVSPEEAGYEHFLRVRARDARTGEVFAEASHPFEISVSGGSAGSNGDSGGGGGSSKSNAGASGGTVAAVVIVIAIVVLGGAGGAYYAKRKEKLCFAAGDPKAPPPDDQYYYSDHEDRGGRQQQRSQQSVPLNDLNVEEEEHQGQDGGRRYRQRKQPRSSSPRQPRRPRERRSRRDDDDDEDMGNASETTATATSAADEDDEDEDERRRRRRRERRHRRHREQEQQQEKQQEQQQDSRQQEPQQDPQEQDKAAAM